MSAYSIGVLAAVSLMLTVHFVHEGSVFSVQKNGMTKQAEQDVRRGIFNSELPQTNRVSSPRINEVHY